MNRYFVRLLMTGKVLSNNNNNNHHHYTVDALQSQSWKEKHLFPFPPEKPHFKVIIVIVIVIVIMILIIFSDYY
jgi:hypothetical protein